MKNVLVETIRTYAAGEVPLTRVFFQDMLVFGSSINVVTGGAALIVYASDVSDLLALAIFLLPLPYNVALCIFPFSAARNGAFAKMIIFRMMAVMATFCAFSGRIELFVFRLKVQLTRIATSAGI